MPPPSYSIRVTTGLLFSIEIYDIYMNVVKQYFGKASSLVVSKGSLDPLKNNWACLFEQEICDLERFQQCHLLCELIENTAFICGERLHSLSESPQRNLSFLKCCISIFFRPHNSSHRSEHFKKFSPLLITISNMHSPFLHASRKFLGFNTL
jgi:hypothetical protein